MSICEYVFTSKPNSLAEVIDTSIRAKFTEQNSVWKIQTDTYQREIERYGEKNQGSRNAVWHDSEMILHYLVLKSSFEKRGLQLLFSFCN
jgi:hypothetical protein